MHPNEYKHACNGSFVCEIDVKMSEMYESKKSELIQNFPQKLKYVKILEFWDYIWSHHEKCIQLSTNLPGIGSLICEIHVQMSEM